MTHIDHVPQLHTGSFLTKKQAEQFRDTFKNLTVVVRCKDCKHGDPCNDGEIYCEKDIGTIETAVHKPEWFCADGERR